MVCEFILAGRLVLFLSAAEVDDGDDEKIEAIIQKCKELFLKLRLINVNSPERALANLLAVDAIKAM